MLWLADSRTTYRSGDYLLSFDIREWSLWLFAKNRQCCLQRGIESLKAGQALAKAHANAKTTGASQ